jgi:hypothetical protein
MLTFNYTLAFQPAPTYHPKKPALDLNDKGLTALPQAIF